MNYLSKMYDKDLELQLWPSLMIPLRVRCSLGHYTNSNSA